MAFRVSDEENAQIDLAVKLTGLTKQDYITRRLLCKDVVVQGNPRIFKALRDQLSAVLAELRRIEAGEGVNDELLDTINLIADITLTKHLNVNAGRLFEEYGVQYENTRNHAGRKITLTPVPEKA